jgi:rhamnosyltransferase
MDTDVSIALLTLNGSRHLPEVLAAVQEQTARPREILAIDSGSTDGTIGLLERAGVMVTAIARRDFGHGRTRNLAARLATGRHIVFLPQDAVPAGPRWLELLLRPFDFGPRVAACFSRHVPRPGGDLLEANDLRVSFGSVRHVKTLPPDPGDYRTRVFDHIRSSNASAAYPRALLHEHPFDDSLAMGEDQEWAKRILERGLAIVYEPDSAVLHSHDHTLAQKYRRHLEMGAAFSSFLSPLVGRWPFPVFILLGQLLSDAVGLAMTQAPLGARLAWLARAPLHRAVIHYAYYRGWNAALRLHANPETCETAAEARYRR